MRHACRYTEGSLYSLCDYYPTSPVPLRGGSLSIIMLFCSFTAMFSKLVFGEHSYFDPPELDLPVPVQESGGRGRKTYFNELQVSIQP